MRGLWVTKPLQNLAKKLNLPLQLFPHPYQLLRFLQNQVNLRLRDHTPSALQPLDCQIRLRQCSIGGEAPEVRPLRRYQRLRQGTHFRVFDSDLQMRTVSIEWFDSASATGERLSRHRRTSNSKVQRASSAPEELRSHHR